MYLIIINYQNIRNRSRVFKLMNNFKKNKIYGFVCLPKLHKSLGLLESSIAGTDTHGPSNIYFGLRFGLANTVNDY